MSAALDRIADALEVLALNKLTKWSRNIEDIAEGHRPTWRVVNALRERIEERTAPAVACEATGASPAGDDAVDRCGHARAGSGEFVHCTRTRGHVGPCAMVATHDPFAWVDYTALRGVFDRWLCRGIYDRQADDVMSDVVRELRRQWKERGR